MRGSFMNVFQTHAQIISDYEAYIRSFVNIADQDINAEVEKELSKGKLWPEPLLQFNPSFEMAGSVSSLAGEGTLHPDIADIFKGFSLYKHQMEAIRLGTAGKDFIVTSGTGSGKSLTYIGTIFHHLLSHPNTSGVTAIVVYPMNALINSQYEEFMRYQANYENSTGKQFPIQFGRYTGQEGEDVRQKMREHPPQIILTNYMMLELLLTRTRERAIRDAIYENLQFLVFDELHTYRGRQGADVAMLIRRISAQCIHQLIYIGTSATMVSSDSEAVRRSQVSEVVSTLFGRQFLPEQIISETLNRSLAYSGEVPSEIELRSAIKAGINPQANAEMLKTHPVAIWLENNVALEECEGNLIRRKPLRMSEIVTELTQQSGVQPEQCLIFIRSLLAWISSVNKRLQDEGHRYTILPFKLHQFISQTGSVYTTLDQDTNRFITLEPGIYKQDEEKKKPIFPNVFSRSTGHAFLCVTRVGNRLEPREFSEASEDNGTTIDGYLIIGEDIWDPANDFAWLPDSWLKRTRKGIVPQKDKIERFPIKLYFNEYGNCSENQPMKWWGWFMKTPLLFDPTGGVFFETRTTEVTKLARLGSEGRSTSTTITAFSILNQMEDAGYPVKDQKLLSFTDNRQDAALQAGHFNDFVQVVRLRAAIHKALQQSPGHTLTYATIGEAVFKALDLPFLEYANRNEEPSFAGVKRNYEQCFQAYLFYRAIADLRRSWKIILPNLEQCALLDIHYIDLSDIAAEDDPWQSVPLVRYLDHEKRREFLSVILDFFRQEYAIHSENYLTQSKIKENEKQFREMLCSPWTLDNREELLEPNFIRTGTLHRSIKLFSKSVGPASSLGKYIKQYNRRNGTLDDLSGSHYDDFINKLLDKLEEADYLMSDSAKNEDNDIVKIYRLRIEKIIWKLGNSQTVKADVIKRRAYREQVTCPNEYFRTIYQRDFSKTKRLRGDDHTGQLSSDERIEREDKFREGKINALFCSPTMELGIDIGGLSVVHLRNAPPNPANYAQRSGRAGRSGQGALVFTFCSGYSPHDRHFFRHQTELVAGAVQAPCLDLCNQELLATHLNALAISEIGIPDMDERTGRRPSLMRLIVSENEHMPLSPAVRAGLDIPTGKFNELKAAFTRTIKDIMPILERQAANWYTDQWVEQRLVNLANNLNETLERWRRMYHSAKMLLLRATQKIESGTLSTTSEEYRKHKRMLDQATRQLELLRNDHPGSTAELSEFYPYRYLAAEGFLPGYNFTRLPIRVFLPTGNTTGEFISRPRSIALREFGPRNIIYHNGRKFRVSQIIVQDADSTLTDAKISKKAGFFLTGEQKTLEICPFSGISLADNANSEYVHDLLEMAESRAEEVDRISCVEEERVTLGYDIRTYFQVDGEHLERIRKAVVRTNENNLLNLRFIPAARLVHINYQWRKQQIPGFPMGLVSGDWRSSMPDSDSNVKEDFRLIKLWTSNLADALYIEPIQPLGLQAEGVITLQHALKRAIESVFQVESNELGVIAVGDPEAPNILLYESAEGSLGILSQFVDNVDIFHKVVETAIAVCRYNDSAYLGPASYDDLLSYYNQRDHKIIDRHLIRTALDKLRISTIELQAVAAFSNYDEQYQTLLRAVDPTSSTERYFLDYLYQHGLRLPDAAQKRVDGIHVQPDFYYEPRFWVFCDGTPHDSPTVQAEDEVKRQAIIAQGDEVWVYYYRDNLAERVSSRPDVFRRVR